MPSQKTQSATEINPKAIYWALGIFAIVVIAVIIYSYYQEQIQLGGGRWKGKCIFLEDEASTKKLTEDVQVALREQFDEEPTKEKINDEIQRLKNKCLGLVYPNCKFEEKYPTKESGQETSPGSGIYVYEGEQATYNYVNPPCFGKFEKVEKKKGGPLGKLLG